MLVVMASALGIAHCAWLVGFESSYSVEASEGGSAVEGGSADAPVSDGPAAGDGGTSSDASAAFGDAIVVASGEVTPIGGITTDSQSIYWTIAVMNDGGVRYVDKDGGVPMNGARAPTGGTLEEIYALPGDTIYWRIAGIGCSATVGCGATGYPGFGLCGLRAQRVRTDGRRLYQLATEANTNKLPIHVVSKGCASMSIITRLDSEAGAASPYSNMVPDLSGNRVFAVAGGVVDCLDVGGGPTVRVVNGNILDMVSDDTHLYWLTPSEVHRCKLGSDVTCSACVDDEVVTKTAAGIQPTLLLDGSSLYWLGPTGVSAIATDAPAGTPETVLVTKQASPVALAVDSSGVYWANSGDGTIMRLPRR